MQSKAKTVTQYLAELPPERREMIAALRKVIRANLNEGFEEGMQYGMLGYAVPHRLYPAGYHADPSQPLPFACIASQKNYCSLYLMNVYGDGTLQQRFEAAWAKTGKKLDMGKSCVRFRTLQDLALDVIADAIRRTTVETYIAKYEASLTGSPRRGAAKAASPRKATPKTRPARKTVAHAKPRAKPRQVRPKANGRRGRTP